MKLTSILTEMSAKKICPKCGHGPITKTHSYRQGVGWKCMHPPINPNWTTKEDYYKLVAKLTEIEHKYANESGQLYLTHEAVDEQNVMAGNPDIDRDSPEFWNRMYNEAAMNAGVRAEAYGLDINKLLGFVVY